MGSVGKLVAPWLLKKIGFQKTMLLLLVNLALINLIANYHLHILVLSSFHTSALYMAVCYYSFAYTGHKKLTVLKLHSPGIPSLMLHVLFVAGGWNSALVASQMLIAVALLTCFCVKG